MKKIPLLFIFNPKAGTQKLPSLLFEVVDKFSAAGFLVTAYPTQAADEVGQIIALHGDEYEYLVCSGGDGTINEAINALIMMAHQPAFGIIPSGTVNDFANSLGIPKDPHAAAANIINHRRNAPAPKAIDIGRFGNRHFGGRHFAYVAAFGKYTDVSYSTPQLAKNLFGKLAYFFEGVKQSGTLESFRCTFDIDGEIIAGDFILGIITNAHSVAGYKLPDEMDVQIDDGYFEVILMHTPSGLMEIQKIIASLLAQEIKSELILFRKARKVIFTSEKPVAWTLDGDFGGEHAEITIENQHRAIEILI